MLDQANALPKPAAEEIREHLEQDRKSTRLNSSHRL